MEYRQWLGQDYFETFCCYYGALVRTHSQGDIEMSDEEAAVRIQSTYKGFKVRKEIEERKKESAAATRIQAQYRGHRTRVELSDKPEDEYPGKSNDEFPGYTEEEAAAIKIQSNFRGHKTRKELADKVGQ